MPFEYQPYHSPFATTIADLILRRGDIAAQRSEQIGNALAHSALASGQAWAGAANNIGQTIGMLPQQIAQAKTQGLNQQLLAGRVADENQFRKGNAAVDQMMQGDQLAPGAVGPRQDSYLDQNGLFDIGKMTQALGQGGMGHLAPDLLKGAESINDSILKHQQLEQAAAQQHVIVLGDTAAGVLKLADSGVPIPQALDFAVQPLLATKRIDPAEYQQVKAQIIALPPEQQRAALTTFMDQAAKLDKGENLAEGAQHVDRYGRVVASGAPKPPTEAALAADAANPTSPTAAQSAAAIKTLQAPTAAARTETARHNAAMEAIQKTQVGREAAANAETARHNKAMEAANNPLAALSGGAPGSAPGTAPPATAGADLLKTLPPQVASQVKALAEGRMQFPGGFALKSPYWQSMISLVSQYDPSFDAVNYNARAATRKDFTSGKSAQTINALNTVAQHLDRLSTSADALNNANFTPYNTLANYLSQKVGNPTVTNFETDKKAVVYELTRAWRQAGDSEQDIKSWSSVLDASNSPTQLHSAIAEMGNLLEGKLSALENQFRQGMGSAADIPVVTPQTRGVLSRLEQKASGGAPSNVPAEGTTRNGATWRNNGPQGPGWYR